MRIDSHQHFWRYNPAEHTWMSEEMAALKHDFLPEDLQPLLASFSLDGCVAVQARQSFAETEWLLSLAVRHDFIRGVVGWLDLCSEHLPKQLERFAANRKLVGVRHVLQDEPDDEFMLRPEFRRGIARLDEFDLAYDLLLLPRHLPVAARLVAEFPEQRFVLDHIAKPGIAGQILSPWREDLNALAAFPNVFCKLSGMVTEANWRDWQPDDFRPYLDAVFAAFGTERLMIGSDWPVCTLAADYPSTLHIVTDYIQHLPPEIQAAIMGETCSSFYRLDV